MVLRCVDFCLVVTEEEGDTNMYQPPWFERVVGEILNLPNRTLLRCGTDTGIDYALNRLHDYRTPHIYLWLDEHNAHLGDESVVSEALAAGLGSRLFNKHASVTQILQALVEYQQVLGPVFMVIGWAHRVQWLLPELVRSIRPESSLIVVADSSRPQEALEGFQEISGGFLKLEFAEAIHEARGAISDNLVSSLFEQSEGKFGTFKSNLLRQLGPAFPRGSTSDPWRWGEAVVVDGVLDALIKHERWSDAFELACGRATERVHELIDEAGNYYFNTGSFSYFWSRLESLPPDVKAEPKIAYWLVSVALATDRQKELRRHVERIAETSDAPEIRASTAVVVPTGEMLKNTSRALNMLRSPATLRAHGFALAWEGERTEPIALFREAMRLAEREGAEHLVVACGVDIAEVEIRHGNLKSGCEWAYWAISEYKRRGINEHLRHKSAVAAAAFAKLLLGDEVEAARLLAGLNVGPSYINVPGYEGVISTLGDVALVQEQYDRALNLYASIHENAPLEVFSFTALSLVAVHIAKRDWLSASGLAENVFAVSRSSTAYERALGELAAGMAFSESDPQAAESLLASAMSGLQAKLHIAQAAAWLAIVRLRQGRRKDAVEALKAGVEGIAELGPSGWKLICAQHPLTEEIRHLWTKAEYEFEFQFLGSRKVRTESGEFEPGLRAAEILAVLAIHTTGLSGEQLHTHVYGEMPYPRSTLKASVSRLRGTVPIGSNPYRIDATFRADFLCVLELISTGKLQRALNLYGGSLLPGSESPLIEEWREHIDESIRSAVLESQDPDHLIQLGTQLDNDLEIWETAKQCLPLNDYRRPVINARIRRIRATWER